jgi:hypothetical protein
VNAALLRDLGAWESGELSARELEDRHGDEAAELVEMHERLAVAALVPMPDADVGWAALAPKLVDQPAAPVIELRPSRRRAVLFAVAAAMVMGGTALALSGARDGAGVSLSVPAVTREVPEVSDPYRDNAPTGERGRGVAELREEADDPSQPAGGDGVSEQGPNGDQQGTHPGKGNDGTDNGKDDDTEEAGPSEGPGEDGSEKGEEPEESEKPGSEESETDGGAKGEEEPSQDGSGDPVPGGGGPTKGGKPEDHGKPSDKGKPSDQH